MSGSKGAVASDLEVYYFDTRTGPEGFWSVHEYQLSTSSRIYNYNSGEPEEFN